MLTQLAFNMSDSAPAASTAGRADPMASLVSNKRGGRTKALAPAPVIDRYPVVIGSNLSLQYLSSVFKLCTTGWRYAYIDALNELLEHDPHVRGTVRQRTLPVAGAALQVLPAKLPDGDENTDLAKLIANEVQRQLDNLPSRAQSFGQLAWGSIYGVSGAEVEWERNPDEEIKWEVRHLHNIHSRRLNYTNPMSWDVYVWDQGSNFNQGSMGPTVGAFGLRVADYPGKFIIHTPALNGDYPTRDGEGRYIAFYMAIKRMIVRCTSQDFERTIRPWIVGYFNREVDGSPGADPIADDEDRAMATQALQGFGTGSMNFALIPNSIKFDVLRAASDLSALEFLKYIDEQITKSLLGQTFTTSPGAHGNKNAADTAKQGTLEVLRYEAQCFADTLERDLVYWIVALNWGTEIAKRLTPRLVARVEEKPDPEQRARVAKFLTEQDVPLDADDLADRCGYKTTPKPEGFEDVPRRTRMVGPGQAPSPDNATEPVGTGDTQDPEKDAAGEAGADPDEDVDVPTPTDAPKPKPKPKPKAPPAGSTKEEAVATSGKKAPAPADPTGDPTNKPTTVKQSSYQAVRRRLYPERS